MEVVLPPLRHSKIVREKGAQHSRDEKALRKIAKGYIKYPAVELKVQKRRVLSSGASALISGGHRTMGEGSWRAVPVGAKE